MKKTAKYTILFLLIVTTFFACDDFIEEDIENEVINLLAPGNNLTTIKLTHTFWWDWLDGAEVYNMQIVEGTFTSVTSFVLDTTVSKNKFDVTLYPGSFQWRIRGENNGGKTDYSTFNLVIDSTLDISSLQVVLNSPSDNFITNNNAILFEWQSLLNADDYLIEVHQNTFSGSVVFGPQIATALNLTATLPEGTLVWGVQARNSTSGTSTTFSTRTLIVDTTNPNAVVLDSPAHNATVTSGFNTYAWTQGINTGTALTDRIHFYSDAAGTLLLNGYPVTLPLGITTHSDSLAAGTYYWDVQTTDAAGNIGPFSNLNTVIIP
ncbi:MAG: hypothetical protein JKY30_07490 [Flavobacteriales bacterium]|nr:hypothetical protein [Flavobacteriales bacterium]